MEIIYEKNVFVNRILVNNSNFVNIVRKLTLFFMQNILFFVGIRHDLKATRKTFLRTEEKRIILSGIHEFYEPEELIGKTCIAITNLPPRTMMGIDSCGMLISAVHTEEGEEKLHLLMVDDHIPAGAKLY